MYCTGGVRCERASAYLRSRGVAGDLCQLDGGIHRYQERYGNGGFFRGRCYVFDPRMAVGAPGEASPQLSAPAAAAAAPGTPTATSGATGAACVCLFVIPATVTGSRAAPAHVIMRTYVRHHVRVDARVPRALEQPHRVGPVAAGVVRRLAARVRLGVDLQEQFVDQVRDLLAQ